jgi:hypothetical protein
MSIGRVERRLAVIPAVDVAGHSQLMGADEEGFPQHRAFSADSAPPRAIAPPASAIQ